MYKCPISFREWYSYHFPELVKIVNENYMYARVAKYIKDRKAFTEDQVEGIEEIVMDSAKAKAIWDAMRSSMGKLRLKVDDRLLYLYVPVQIK